MSIEIRRYRLTFIWTGTVIDAPSVANRFSKRTAYERLFDALQVAEDPELALPWLRDKPYAHRFWVHYLAVPNPGHADGTLAWSKAVPFRAIARPATLDADWFPAPNRIFAEHYFHPFGIGLVLTFEESGAFTPQAWLGTATSIPSKASTVAFGNDPPQSLNIKGLASQCLQRLRDTYFGTDAKMTLTSDPFSIMTVIRGDGVDASIALQDGDPIHQLLFGAATLRANWETADLSHSPLAQCRLDIRSGSSPGDAVFAAKRGLAIWSPSSFTKKEGSGYSQSCYHRNQVLGALQVESLCNLAAAVAARVTSSSQVSARPDNLGEIAARLLVSIYNGDANDTYRSVSLQRHIQDHGSVPSIKLLCARYGLPTI